MELSPVLLLKLLIYSVLWGVFIGVINTVNKAFRAFINFGSSERMSKYYERALPIIKKPLKDILILKHRSPVIKSMAFIQDLFTSIAYVIGLLFINYSLNQGVFRFFCIPASVLSMIVYRFTLEDFILILLELLCYIIKAITVVLIYLISRPFVHISTKISKKCKTIYLFFKKSIAKQIKKRYNICREEHLMNLSKNAFIDLL